MLCVAQSREKPADVSGRPEQDLFGGETFERSEDVGAMIATKPPNKSEKLRVELFATAIGHVGTVAMPSENRAPDGATQTTPLGEVEEDGGICRLEAECECRSIVSVDDPGVSCKLGGELCTEFSSWRLDPTGSPMKPIKVDERQAAHVGEPTSESRFAGSGTAENENALHNLPLAAGKMAMKRFEPARNYFFRSGGNHVN